MGLPNAREEKRVFLGGLFQFALCLAGLRYRARLDKLGLLGVHSGVGCLGFGVGGIGIERGILGRDGIWRSMIGVYGRGGRSFLVAYVFFRITRVAREQLTIINA
jgi:hypothetical protein